MNKGILVLFFMMANNVFAQQVFVENPVRFLALGDSYTIGQGVPADDRWPLQLAERLQNQGVAVEELKIIAQTGWRTDNLLSAIAAENHTTNYNLVSLLNFILPHGANEITVFNSLGVQVYSAEIENSNSFSINVSEWNPGIYFYRIKNAEQTYYTGKFQVK